MLANVVKSFTLESDRICAERWKNIDMLGTGSEHCTNIDTGTTRVVEHEHAVEPRSGSRRRIRLPRSTLVHRKCRAKLINSQHRKNLDGDDPY